MKFVIAVKYKDYFPLTVETVADTQEKAANNAIFRYRQARKAIKKDVPNSAFSVIFLKK